MARAPRGCLDPLRVLQLIAVRLPIVHRLAEELRCRHDASAAIAPTRCLPFPSHCSGLPKLGVAEFERGVSNRLQECD